MNYAKTFKLSCLNNEEVWTDVENGKIFTASVAGSPEILKSKLASPISCKALRIIPLSYNGWIGLRSEVIIID